MPPAIYKNTIVYEFKNITIEVLIFCYRLYQIQKYFSFENKTSQKMYAIFEIRGFYARWSTGHLLGKV